MEKITSNNEFVIKFANVNGSGSASANNLFAKSIFRMGIPVGPRNIFPSNIQGLPTWFEVRVSEKGHLGRRGGVDMMVAMNPQSFVDDVNELNSGGYLLYDSTKPIDFSYFRNDINWIGIPLTDICIREFENIKQRQLFKNIIYVGALAALLDMDFAVVKDLIKDQFSGKEKLIAPNVFALELGHQWVKKNLDSPIGIQVSKSEKLSDEILIDGNTAAAIGCLYGGASCVGWYPITPSTSVIDAFTTYCERLRIDPGTGKKKYAILQAEDELAAIGMVIGASWNGARAFTATSGPGISLMSEFLGLAYFAEIPLVLFDIQRGGPSTGMPTRTQQSDLLSAAYASHGDTKQVLLFPSNPKECFEMAAQAFDLTERLQTPVIVMSDLDLGMNEWTTEKFEWDDARTFDRGKVLDAEALEAAKDWGRYKDEDGDGIPYRTYPGTHPNKGAYFTRGTSRDAYAIYTEKGEEYILNMERLERKFKEACKYLPKPVFSHEKQQSLYGVAYFGTSSLALEEAVEMLEAEGMQLDLMRIRAFPFEEKVFKFIEQHKQVFVIEQNRDAQMCSMLVNEGELDSAKLPKILHYNGMPITANFIFDAIKSHLDQIAEGNPSKDEKLKIKPTVLKKGV